MVTVLRLTYPEPQIYGRVCIPNHEWHREYRRIIVPEPYQAGDTPEQVFLEHYGVLGFAVQHGNQPR